MPTVETIEKKTKSKKGGYRPGSGRKPLVSKAEVEQVRKLIEQHSIEIDPKDKKKRARILRLLDTLYEEGIKKRNIAAIREYLDRQLGKSKEDVDLTSAGEKVQGFSLIPPNERPDSPHN
jgi:hypothetical protein